MGTAAHMLLVDDDPQTRELLSGLLGKNGVDIAGNGGAMKRVLGEARMHLIVLD
jgi:DNA-binding response OmpR family regulator